MRARAPGRGGGGMLRHMAGRAGIGKRVHPHGLPHALAGELRQAGADVVTISKLLAIHPSRLPAATGST